MIDVGHIQQRSIVQARKTELLQNGTNSQSRYWMKLHCNPISCVAKFRKYVVVELHTSDDFNLNKKTKYPTT